MNKHDIEYYKHKIDCYNVRIAHLNKEIDELTKLKEGCEKRLMEDTQNEA